MTGSRSKLALLYSSAPLPAQHRVGSPIKASSTDALHRGMDDNNRRRRQNEPPLQHTNTRYHQTVQNPTQQAHRTMAGTTTERYRPAPLNTSPQGGARAGIGGGSAGYGAYYQEPSATGFSTAAGIHQNTMGYQQSATSYGQDGRQTQNFAGSYNPTMMYNVPQATTQNPVYDTPGSSFDLRQPAAPQMMPADTTMTAQYFSNEPTNAAAASAMQQQQPSSAQAAAVYQQGPSDRNTMMNYPSNIAGMQTIGAQATPTAPPDVSMEDSSEYPGGADLNQAYTQYQDALKEIFKNIRDGALVTASESLLSVSEWLLSHVHELGKNDFLPTGLGREPASHLPSCPISRPLLLT